MAHDGAITASDASSDNHPPGKDDPCPACGAEAPWRVIVSDPVPGAPGPLFGQEPEGRECTQCGHRVGLPADDDGRQHPTPEQLTRTHERE